MDLARKIALFDEQISAANGGSPDNFEAWHKRTEVVFRTVFGNASPMHAQFNSIEYAPGIWFEGMDTSGYQPAGVREAIALMEAAKLELEITDAAGSQAPEAQVAKADVSTRVFIVHGQDDAKKFELESYLHKLLGEEPVILHQEPNAGRVLIEKLEGTAAAVGYAVVLLTGDDVGRAAVLDASDEQARARQNVVFEMGFFIGLIGRQRVAILYEEGVELPSDISGLVYTKLDAGGGWKAKLASDMNHAGIPVDWAAVGRV